MRRSYTKNKYFVFGSFLGNQREKSKREIKERNQREKNIVQNILISCKKNQNDCINKNFSSFYKMFFSL
jgi:hypothetical protein